MSEMRCSNGEKRIEQKKISGLGLTYRELVEEDESSAEDHLACKANDEPDWISGYLFSYGTSEKLNYRLQHIIAPY